MAFACKVPLSRRQVWENKTGLSQFSLHNLIVKQRKDYVDSVHHQQHSSDRVRPPWSTRTDRRASQLHHQQQQHHHHDHAATGDYADNNNGQQHQDEDVQAAVVPATSTTTKRKYRMQISDSDSTIAKYLASERKIELADFTSAVQHREEAVQQQQQDKSRKSTIIYTPGKLDFSKVDVFFICISILLYIGDIGLDCFVAYKHYLDIVDHPLYFYFTIAFVFLAGIITSVFSLWWYYFEYQIKKELTPDDLPSRAGFIIRIVACCLTMGPVVRYIDTISYGLHSRVKRLSPELRQYYHDEMQFQRADGAMLRLFEAFLESAPQFLLQVFIIFQKGRLDGEQEGNYFLGECCKVINCKFYCINCKSYCIDFKCYCCINCQCCCINLHSESLL